MNKKPLAIDLFCGLGGWSEALLAEGWDVIGFDIEQHCYDDLHYPGQLVLQDVLTLHGKQFANADLIVASPPCQEYSYMAMPFSRGKQIEKALLYGDDPFPENYSGSRTIGELNALFNACFRIQREASEAAGRRIPLIVENVKGAQKWVGRARWNYGSYYLWGNVPALMPMSKGIKNPGQNWSRFKETGEQSPHWSVSGLKNTGGSWFSVAHNITSGCGNNPDGRKQGGDWFSDCSGGALRNYSSKSNKCKKASAMIAKIPFPLAQHIARVFYPNRFRATA